MPGNETTGRNDGAEQRVIEAITPELWRSSPAPEPPSTLALPVHRNAMNLDESERECYHELTAYTLSHTDPAFIHQYAVDAFAAQTADDTTKPITLAFALMGLYLI